LEPVQDAILKTLAYGDVFNFPMTAAEIHHFLLTADPIDLSSLDCALDALTRDGAIDRAEGYYTLAGRADLIPTRVERERASHELLPVALTCGVWLARLPFVRMVALVALTGALSMHNAAAADDDLDYMLVTAAGRVWLARAFSIALVKLAKLRGVTICPNYVLAETALAQDRQDLFIAHEVAQMLPLYGEPLYWTMRDANEWSSLHLANATQPFHPLDEAHLSGPWNAVKRGLEALLGGRLGNALEGWEQRRKLRRFAAEMSTPHSAARLDGEHVKGHFNDHGHRVLEAYRERLRRYGLTEAAPTPEAVN
jgi:hypothetical protein